jgi:hypothetical protein
MPLSRLNNFLKSVRGNIIYVNPNDLDSTDSIENQGNSLTRPFKTIQRALIEAARFSYQSGLDNDRFGKTTILVYPGDYTIDNRPGWIPYNDGGTLKYKNRNGADNLVLSPYSLSSSFDLTFENNDLYKLNSVHGGVIIPRGTSLVGLDLRKTKIRPKYIPNPENDNIERSSIFRLTGACYLWQFTVFDGDPNDVVYKDYTNNLFVPNFSHHKLTAFEYADGVNNVSIDDTFLTQDFTQTDLDMYYIKVGDVYDQSSGRAIEPDYPLGSVDIQPKIDEYQIVGPSEQDFVISNIKSGDGVTGTTTITVTTTAEFTNIDVDTPILIDGIAASGYNGQFVVSEVVSSTQFKYTVQNIPTVVTENPTSATVTLVVDTVTSASPYVFNISLRSVFGMCGLHADGSKATGFRSMVVAQFTGIGLQKDNNAFLLYDPETGTYEDSTTQPNLYSNSRSVYRPEYRNFHIKCSNDSILQLVSIFAIGYADHFLAESGGDQSITNSNSNFGARSLVTKGYKSSAFARDDRGYITHVIPPRFVTGSEITIEYTAIDVSKTVSVADTSRLYLYGETNAKSSPSSIIDGYRIGSKVDDKLNVIIAQNEILSEKSARIIMPNTAYSASETTSEKTFAILRDVNDVNTISSNTITLTASHNLINGESIRFIAENGDFPSGISENVVYYAITSGVAANQIKIAKSLSDALTGNATIIYPTGGVTKVVSRVSDKRAGEPGHPIQYDSTNSNWYINVATASTENTIYSTIVSLGTTSLGAATPRTFIKRESDTRNLVDTIYRYRYSIPKSYANTRPPVDGFVLQESANTSGASNSEIQSTTLGSVTDRRNYKLIANATYSGGYATVTTEEPHKLTVGSEIQVVNVKSTNNTLGTSSTGYNRTALVVSVPSDKTFTYAVSSDPGTFTNNTNARTVAETAYVKRTKYDDTFYIYRSQEVRRQTQNAQDGIYHIINLNASNSPSASQFTDESFSQRITDLYPQQDRDNPESDPDAAKSFATSYTIGKVVTNDLKNSITKETLDKFVVQNNIGIGVTSLVSSSVGTSHTIYTGVEHGLNPVVNVGIVSAGFKYGTGSSGTLYNARLVGFAGSTTGEGATAKIAIDANGAITNVQIVSGGSAYGIGNTLTIVGVATTAGHVVGVVSVTSIYNNVGDVIKVSGVSSDSYRDYNSLYRVSSVENSKSIVATSTTTISGFSTTEIPTSLLTNSYFYNTGKSIPISSLTYDNVSGIATVVTSAISHGLDIGNVVSLVGATTSLYVGNFVVTEDVDLTTFNLNIGISTQSPAFSGTVYAYRRGFESNDGQVSVDDENIGARMTPIYGGISAYLNTDISNETTTTIEIANASTSGLRIGDYIVIDAEILRIASTIDSTSSNSITVFRGVFGTRSTTHLANIEIRKITPIPVELRRNSIIRASGHTFEYVGYGPGNYSTALPDRQDRSISADEELLSQATKQEGGIVVFTGMNNDGDFYIGNKRVSSATGQEEVFDAPVPTRTGEDVNPSGINVGFDILTPIEISISRSIRVEGGPRNDIISEFDGPTVFNEKVTINSPKGIEANSIFLQGDETISRKYTVGISTPSLAGNSGDITYFSSPGKGNHLGWVYTKNNDWFRFGNISLSKDANHQTFDKIGIGVSSFISNLNFQAGIGTTSVVISGLGSVGIGITDPTQRLDVLGGIKATGGISAGSSISIGNTEVANLISGTIYLYGDASNLVNVPNDSLWGYVNVGLTSAIYPFGLPNVGVGTSAARFDLEVGTVGLGTTSLWVNNGSRFIGTVNTNNDLISNGRFISTNTFINNATGIGTVNVGIVTASTRFDVGIGGTIIRANSTGSVGIRTATVRSGADVDIEGRTRLGAYFESVQPVTSSSGRVSLDVSRFQNFTITTTENITSFDLVNCPPSGSFSFTFAITQDATTARSVSIDIFTSSTSSSPGLSSPVRWAGGVVPTVTLTPGVTDIYSFVTFDAGLNLYGITGGQNFS